MSQTYREVYLEPQLSETFYRLPPVPRLLWYHIKASPSVSSPVGILRLSPSEVAEDLNIARDEMQEALSRLCDDFGWKYDPRARLLYCPEWLQNAAKSNSTLKSLIASVAYLPRSLYLEEWFADAVAFFADRPAHQHEVIALWNKKFRGKDGPSCPGVPQDGKASGTPQGTPAETPLETQGGDPSGGTESSYQLPVTSEQLPDPDVTGRDDHVFSSHWNNELTNTVRRKASEIAERIEWRGENVKQTLENRELIYKLAYLRESGPGLRTLASKRPGRRGSGEKPATSPNRLPVFDSGPLPSGLLPEAGRRTTGRPQPAVGSN